MYVQSQQRNYRASYHLSHWLICMWLCAQVILLSLSSTLPKDDQCLTQASSCIIIPDRHSCIKFPRRGIQTNYGLDISKFCNIVLYNIFLYMCTSKVSRDLASFRQLLKNQEFLINFFHLNGFFGQIPFQILIMKLSIKSLLGS